MKSAPRPTPCPCGGGDYQRCCGPYIAGTATADTAEQLMRSRYTAYTRCDDVYLRRTWSASSCPTATPISEPGIKWLGLTINRHVEDGEHAIVEFIARYKVQGRAHRLHEISRFVREEGLWFYVAGVQPDQP